MLKTMKLADLDFDESLYPRKGGVDEQTVNMMGRAFDAGATFPPIVADKATKKVVDGFHRGRMYLKKGRAETEVELVSYKTVADLFLDAVKRNATHGRKLSPWDHVHCLSKAQELGIEREYACEALVITRPYADKLVVERLSAEGEALKVTTAPVFAGRSMSAAQSSYNLSAGGKPQTFYVNQVIRMIETDSVDKENAVLVGRLLHLKSLLDSALKN